MIEAVLERVDDAFVSRDPRMIVVSSTTSVDRRMSFVHVRTEVVDFSFVVLRTRLNWNLQEEPYDLPKKLYVSISDPIPTDSRKRAAREATVRMDDAAGRIVCAQRLLVSG